MYTTTNLATLQSRLADRYESTVFWTPEEGRLAINEAIRFYNLLVGYWKKRVELTTTIRGGPQWWYQTPKPILYPLRVDFKLQPLVQASLYEMDLIRPNWEAETTLSGGDVPDVPTLWIPVGFTLFALWPADGVGQLSLSVDGITVAPVLTNPDDYLDLGEEEIGILLGYALHVLAFKIGGQIFAETVPLYQAFLRHAALRNTRLATSKAFRKLLDRSSRRDSIPGAGSQVPAA